jgi:lipopolysaccharide/colanic/teichoic acid biosynthesis glycosyltransferase
MAVKRLVDTALTALGLLLVAPLLALIALVIKCDSQGPVFFRQTRAGVGGKPFEMLKFRTMRVGADAEKHLLQHLNEYPDPRLFKIKNDPRITRVGRILRRTSLDELPQLWNVLRGDMSLVGPRPCVPEELRHYSQHHLSRLFVIPGITGPWQVGGRNRILDFEEVIRLETEYIESWSLAKDLLILLKTIPTLFRRGAY